MLKRPIQDALPYLLAWLISFDLFTDAVSVLAFPWTAYNEVPFWQLFIPQSAKVKNGYLDALRSSSVVEKRLLPLLFMLLNIGASGKPFTLDVWSVDDFDVSCSYFRTNLNAPSSIDIWFICYSLCQCLTQSPPWHFVFWRHMFSIVPSLRYPRSFDHTTLNSKTVNSPAQSDLTPQPTSLPRSSLHCLLQSVPLQHFNHYSLKNSRSKSKGVSERLSRHMLWTIKVWRLL